MFCYFFSLKVISEKKLAAFPNDLYYNDLSYSFYVTIAKIEKIYFVSYTDKKHHMLSETMFQKSYMYYKNNISENR